MPSQTSFPTANLYVQTKEPMIIDTTDFVDMVRLPGTPGTVRFTYLPSGGRVEVPTSSFKGEQALKTEGFVDYKHPITIDVGIKFTYYPVFKPEKCGFGIQFIISYPLINFDQNDRSLETIVDFIQRLKRKTHELNVLEEVEGNNNYYRASPLSRV